MDSQTVDRAREIQAENDTNLHHWDKTKDIVDQFIDMTLNFRQSGHPGGSRSKVHGLVATLLGNVMRWDVRHPEKRYNDRFVLVAGHCTPLLYATLATMNEAMRRKYEQTGDSRYLISDFEKRALVWEDLLTFRRRGGLPGHAEMEGKTLFVKFNTGPSGHGSPPAAGAAMALKRAGADDVRVFAFEGEGGLTTGATHEVKNSAWGLGLDNLVYVIDWNDFGIDERAASAVVPGTPEDWFAPYGWRVVGTEHGSDFEHVNRALVDCIHGDNPPNVPRICWLKTRKGRGYLKYDFASHGAPHKSNSEIYWETKKPFMEKYGIEFEGYGEPRPEDPDAFHRQAEANFRKVVQVMHRDQELIDYLANRLADIGDSVPVDHPKVRIDLGKNPWKDAELTDFENYPSEMWKAPGEQAPNRAALATWGAWANTWARRKYGRPLIIASSADLADSTNISGFAKSFKENGTETEGWGWYDRDKNPDGALLPQEITEFANAGISVGIGTVNLSPKPFEEFDGFGAACSTYGSFSYLKYGLMRLYSQVAQDSPIKVGKVIWVAGHSGPETADDSRTHFGIFATGVTQLFPDGHVIDVHPWEYNEVPVVIGAALKTKAAIIALHLTRPPVEIPDRKALGIDSHFAAAKGAYLMRKYDPSKPKHGTILVTGTSTTANVVKLLPELDKHGLNVKVVSVVSPQLFELQGQVYRDQLLPQEDWMDSTVISNRSRRVCYDWLPHKIAAEYAMTSDFDDRWRTGGNIDEVIEEAHLSPDHLLSGIEKFARERQSRLSRLRDAVEKAQG